MFVTVAVLGRSELESAVVKTAHDGIGPSSAERRYESAANAPQSNRERAAMRRS
jgi:hypothetical protein